MHLGGTLLTATIFSFINSLTTPLAATFRVLSQPIMLGNKKMTTGDQAGQSCKYTQRQNS